MSETPGNGTDNKRGSVVRKKKRIGRISRFVVFLFVISLTGYGTAAAQPAAGVDSDPVFPFAFDLVLDEDTITYREEPAEIRQEELPPVEIGTRPVCTNPRCITQTQPYLPPLVKRIGDVDCCAFCDAALS